MRTRTNMQRSVRGIAGVSTSETNPANHNRTGSERHPYTRAEFWCSPISWFWESDLYSEKSKEMYRAFVKEQQKVMDRTCKENLVR